MKGKARKATAEREYEPTEADRQLVSRVRDRRKARHPAPRVHATSPENGTLKIKPDHPDDVVWRAAYMEALGTVEDHFASLLTTQLGNILTGPNQETESHHLNTVLAAMHGIAPKDETEAMLAAQMIASHVVAMEMNRRVLRADFVDPMNGYGNLANKYMRTYAAQTETLKRYRAKAQQTVRVESVYVNEGGQAIVGNVQHRPRGEGVPSEPEVQPHAKEIAHAPEPPLRCTDPEREPVPRTSDAER